MTSEFHSQHSVKCAGCSRKGLCFPLGIASKDLPNLEHLISVRKTIKRGNALYRASEPMDAIFAVRLGFLKSVQITNDGSEQITGFHMAGELLGLDGFSSRTYTRDVYTLEDTEVCVIPYDHLTAHTKYIPNLMENLLNAMSKEIVQEQTTITRLGSTHANEKVASFIIDLSERYEARGFSKSEFVLRMNRAEIGSYLGIKLETVSRVFSRFSQLGIIEVTQRRIRIVDHNKLRQISHDYRQAE